MNQTDEFEAHRPMLFSIAYRILGSATDAEDMVQDAWLRFAAADRDDVKSVRAYLAKIATRLSLDRLKSAQATREEYIGPWLPEPIATEPGLHQEEAAVRAETITLAFLTLLESLSPNERAAFVLREAFDYGYEEISEILESSPSNSRQLVHRARTKLAEMRPRYGAGRHQAREVVGKFLSAVGEGDMSGIERLLTENVTFHADGGGKVVAAKVPVFGRNAVARLFSGFARTAERMGDELDLHIEIRDVNAEPAIVIWNRGDLFGVFSCSVVDGLVESVRGIRNPEKLRYLERELRQSDIAVEPGR